jgi:heptosyltransferase II
MVITQDLTPFVPMLSFPIMHKILIVGPSWIGDAVMAQTLFKLIKQQNPDSIIHVLAPPWVKPILDFMPEIDHSIIWPFSHGELNLPKRYQFGKSLRNENYTQAIILTNSFKSALIPFWAKILVRTGWRGEMRYGLLNDLRTLNKTKLPLMVQRFAALAFTENESLPKQLPSPQLTIDENIYNTICQKFGLNLDYVIKSQNTDITKAKGEKILALCPGGEYGQAKRWSPEYFAEVAKNKLNSGWQVWLFGSKKDLSITDIIQKLTNNACLNFAGNTSLDEATVLLSLSQVVISNDTGLMHIAAALQRPLIAIYGATSPRFTPPLSENKCLLQLNLECSPCFKRSCPLKHNRYRCLTDLKPQMVLDAFAKINSGVKS